MQSSAAGQCSALVASGLPVAIGVERGRGPCMPCIECVSVFHTWPSEARPAQARAKASRGFLEGSEACRAPGGAKREREIQSGSAVPLFQHELHAVRCCAVVLLS